MKSFPTNTLTNDEARAAVIEIDRLLTFLGKHIYDFRLLLGEKRLDELGIDTFYDIRCDHSSLTTREAVLAYDDIHDAVGPDTPPEDKLQAYYAWHRMLAAR